MPTQEHDSWLSGLGVDVDKVRSWASKEVDTVKDDVNKAENWATDEVQKGADWVKAEANKAVEDVKQGADWVKAEANKAVGAVKQDADAVKVKALGDQSGKPVPRPMESDCKPEHGYVPGPKNHLLCATHGHVVDTDQKTIIANSVASYLKDGVDGAAKKIKDTAEKTVGAAPSLAGDGKAALDEVGGATGGIGSKIQLEFPVKVPPGEEKVDLGYVYGEGSVSYAVTYEPADSDDPNAAVTLKNGQAQYELELKKSLSQGVILKGDATISGTKGSNGAELEIPGSGSTKTTIGFEFVDIDAKKAKVNFAELKWKTECKPVSGITELGTPPLKIKYSAQLTAEVDFEPNWEKLGKYALEKFGVSVAEDAAAAGGTGGAGAVAVSVAPAAGVAGGIVGGFALTVGVCAGIGKLEDLGKDAMAVCQEGATELRAYAESYGSTMRGKPGSRQEGNADAEKTLQAIMQKNPGATHDQAVQAAIDSKQNYEDLAYRALLPTMRQQITEGYKKKEGTVGWLFSENVFETVLNDVLDENKHYS